MSVLDLKGVDYRTNGADLLEDISLSVDRGETVAVIGPSGAGKTTMLRVAATFDRPTRGTVAHDGTDVWAVSGDERLELRRRIAMVFQEPNLFDTTVAANVRYGRRVRQPWSRRLTRRMREVLPRMNGHQQPPAELELVGLEDRLSAPVGELSTGEAHRVAMARALAVDPAVLLLDEPTANLDPRNTAKLEDAIEAATARETGVLLATHDMAQAQRVADRTAVLLDGTLAEVGPTERIFDDPDDDRVTRFIEGELVY